MTADNETAATEAEVPVLLPEDLSGPDAGRDPAAGSAPADGPESQPQAACTTCNGTREVECGPGCTCGVGTAPCPDCTDPQPAATGVAPAAADQDGEHGSYEGPRDPEPAEADSQPEPQPAPEPAPRVSLRELQARISVPLQCAAEPHWPDLMKRAAADQEPWAELTDSLIAAGHAEMYDRQVRVWFGDKAPAAAA